MKLRYIQCDVGAQRFAFDLENILGFDRVERVARGPEGSPIFGTLQVSSQQYPVYRLGELLGVESGQGKHIAIVKTGSDDVGIVVDRVSPVQETESLHQLSTLLGDPIGSFYQGAIIDAERLILLIAAEKFGSKPIHRERPLVPLEFPRELVSEAANARDRLVIVESGQTLESGRTVSFGFSLSQVVEVLDLPPITPVPGSPEFVRGICCWRQQAVPVVDWSLRLGYASSVPGPRARLLIVRGPEFFGPVGVMVPTGMRVVRLPLVHQMTTQEWSIDPQMIQQVVELRKETLMLSDFAAALKVAV